jgi:phage gp46-like protein
VSLWFSGWFEGLLSAASWSSPFPVPDDLPQEGRAAGDLALTWSNLTGDADMSRIEDDTDVSADKGLLTAAVLSLFTDRRAENDDVPPSGDPRDRRGWWGDQFAAVDGDRFGSRLWLLDRSKLTNETALRAKEYALEALAWMLEDRVVASIDVTTDTTSNALLFGVDLNRPGRDPVSFKFAHTWNHLQENA